MIDSALVVGAHGKIGSALFNQLLVNQTSVFGTTHRVTTPSIFYLNLLDDPASWQLPSVPFDVAYLTAGVCRMAQCESDPVTTRQTNINGMGALVRRLSDLGVFIVYLSTNQVFSGCTPFELIHAPRQPMNEYGRQKAAMEAMIAAECQQFAIVRLSKVVEPHMSLVGNWIDQMKQHQTVRAFYDMILAPVSLRQVVDTLIQIGCRKQSGFYHLSGSHDISYFELARYIATALKLPGSLVRSDSALNCGIQKNFLPQFTTLDCSSIIARGEHPPHFSEVLRECFGIW